VRSPLVYASFACLFLAGCDLLFGMDHFDDPDDGPVGDPIEVFGKFTRHSMHNDGSRVPVAEMGSPQTLAARVAFADGSQLDLAPDATGTFSFKTPDGRPYSLTFATDFQTVTYQLTAAQLVLIEESGGRLPRLALAQGTLFHLSLTVPIGPFPTADATHHQELISTGGIWTRTALNTQTLAGAPMDWTAVVPLSGPIGRLEAPGNADDVMWYVNYVDKGAYFSITDSGYEPHANIGDTAGDNRFGATSMARAPNGCAMVAIDPGKEIDRLDLLTASAGTTPIGRWSIVGAPFSEFLPEVRIPAAYHEGDDSAPTSAITYATLDVTNPLPSYAELEVSVTGAPALHTIIDVPAAPMCAATTIGVDELVKVPTQIKLAGKTLTMNGDSIAADRSKPIAVTWVPSNTGAADYYVTRLVDAGAGATRATIVSIDPKVTLDPKLVLKDHMYSLVITARRGAPDAAAGDFTVRGTVIGIVEATTTSFQVP
jgi:hypothetical protein